MCKLSLAALVPAFCSAVVYPGSVFVAIAYWVMNTTNMLLMLTIMFFYYDTSKYLLLKMP